MPRFVIERDIPGVGSFDSEAFRAAAKKSNGVISEMNSEKKNIQWEHSYVADDKTFCIYISDNESLLREHSERSGFPITRIIKAQTVIDPVTAE
jgi:hypothetical protein